MKAALPSLLFAGLCTLSGAAFAQDCDCATTSPPSPPAPPAPPALPVPPVPPAPPPMPAVPEQAHLMCAGKPAGTEVSYAFRKGEVMRGTCEPVGGKMMFALDAITAAR